MTTLLSKVLKLPEFRHFQEVASDDWRDTTIDNPGYSISSKGWFDHRTGERGSLESLLEKPLDIEGIYNNSTLTNVDEEIIREYFKTREIEIDPFIMKLSGMRVNRYKDQFSIVTPMRDLDGKIQTLHTIQIDQFFKKKAKSRMLGRAKKDRGILLTKTFGDQKKKKLLQCEGLEDGIVLFMLLPEFDVLITGPAVNHKRGIAFYELYSEVTIVLDNDHDKASIRHSYHCGESVFRLMPKDEGFDANEAHVQGCFFAWWRDLRAVPFAEVVKEYEREGLGKQNEVIDDLNDKHAMIIVSGKVCIMHETTDPNLNNRPRIDLWNKTDFLTWYADRWLNIEDSEGTVKRVNAASYWINSPKKRKFSGFVLEDAEQNGKYFNLWRGFSMKPKPGCCDLYYQHIHDNIACGDSRVYEYLLDWMADAIQHPLDRLPETAIILKGAPGTGKSFMVEHFGKLFGTHYLYINNAKYLTGAFNGHLKDCVFLFADEAFMPTKEHSTILNSIVTQEFTMVEYKGKDAFPFRNRIHLMMASNRDFVLPVDLDDRRFFILRVGDAQRKNRAYFAAIKKELDAGGYEALLHDLKNRDISKVNLLNFPETDAIAEAKLRSLNSIGSWLFDGLVSGDLPDDRLTIGELYGRYVEYAKNLRSRVESKALWSRELKKFFPEIAVRRREKSAGRHYDWTTNNAVDEGRSLFEKQIGQVINWERYGSEIFN